MRISDWSSDVCSSDLRIVDIDRRDHGPGPAARIRGRTGPFEIIAVIDSYQQLVRQWAGVELEPHVHVAGEDLGMRHCLVRITVDNTPGRSEEHTSELQSLMRISYAVFCLKKKNNTNVYYLINTIICTTSH